MTNAVHGNTRWTAEDQARARRLYVEEGKSVKECAKALGCSDRTVHTWVKNGRWREAREGWLAINGVPIEDLEERALRRILGRLDREGDNLQTKELLDLLKHVNQFKLMIAKRQGYRLLDAALVVGDEFTNWVLAECPVEAPCILEAWKGFLDDTQQRSAQ